MTPTRQGIHHINQCVLVSVSVIVLGATEWLERQEAFVDRSLALALTREIQNDSAKRLDGFGRAQCLNKLFFGRHDFPSETTYLQNSFQRERVFVSASS